MTLDMLNVMLAVSEEGMIEEMLLALLASPQLAVFFEKFPRLKNIIAADIPRWREAVRARLKEVNIPPIWTPKCKPISRLSCSLPRSLSSSSRKFSANCTSSSPLLPPVRRSWWMTMPPLPRRCIRCFTALAPEHSGASHQP